MPKPTVPRLPRLALLSVVLGGSAYFGAGASHRVARADDTPTTDVTLTLPDALGRGQVRREPRYGQQDRGQRHGLGARVEEAGVAAPTTTTQSAGVTAASLPASVDLSLNAPPVGDQGQVNSCAAWVEDYAMRGYYAKRDGYFPAGGSPATGSFEPMYTYAQIVKGQNIGTYMSDHLNIMQSQGIDSRGDYSQGDYDYTTQPSAAETANAAHYKISSWSNLFASGTPGIGAAAQQDIENALAAGNPVGLLIPVYDNFSNLAAGSSYVDMPTAGMTNYGNHAVTAFRYDANGVWIENSWGTGWGQSGWAELSWAFVNGYAYQGVVMTPVNLTAAPSPTSIPPTNTPQPSATPASPTSTAKPANTAISVPPTSTITPSGYSKHHH